MDKLNELLKECLVDFRLIEGGSLILFFGRRIGIEPFLTWLRFCIDCAWRLEKNSHLVIGSLNEPQMILPHLSLLKGIAITGVYCDPISKDLCIQFEQGMRLRTFTHSTQDEIWELRRGDGFRYGIGPMGQAFERMEEPDLIT